MTVAMTFQRGTADCGVACLAMAAQLLDVDYDLDEIRHRFYIPPNGMSILHLVSIAEGLGLECKPLKLELEALKTLETPAILHWGMNHYVVLQKIRGQTYHILDPAQGRLKLSRQEVKAYFTGIAIGISRQGDAIELENIARLGLLDAFRLVPRWQIYMAACAITGVVPALAVFVFPFFFRIVLDHAALALSDTGLALLVGIFVLVSMIFYGVSIVRSIVIQQVAGKIDARLAQILPAATHQVSYDHYLKVSRSTLLDVYADLRQFRTNLAAGVVQIIGNGTALALLLIVSFFVNVALGAALTAYAGLHYLISDRYTLSRKEERESMMRSESREAMILNENFNFFQTLRINGGDTARLRMWWELYRHISRQKIKSDLRLSVENASIEFLRAILRATVVTGAAILTMQGAISVENLFVLMLVAILFATFVGNVVADIEKLALASEALSRASLILSAERDPMHPDAMPAQGTDGQVVVHHPLVARLDTPVLRVLGASYRYDGTAPFLFEGLGFDVQTGETVCITGPSGVGKTTLLRILAGLQFVENGRIDWFGQEISKIPRPRFIEKVGFVLQEDGVFSGSLAQNIALFEPTIDEARMQAACRDAALTDLLQRLPMGLFTPLHGNAFLSTGEKHRLLLARALYRNPDVLVLDEMSGNLDADVEEQVFSRLALRNVTMILTSHRERTIRRADRIINLTRADFGTALGSVRAN